MSSRPAALLLPSPFLPGSVLDDLAAALGRVGLPASVAPSALAPGEDATDLVARWAHDVGEGTVLVAHSNAGYLAPQVRAAVRTAPPVVFVDAALPPESGSHRLAPAAFRAWLGTLADGDGVLPPWTRWWPRADLEAVLPPERFAAVDDACPRLPLGYVDTVLTAPPGWAEGPNAYLAFGPTYADERRLAERHGWPTADLGGAHLLLLTEPDAVAAAVVDLAAAL